MRVLTVFALMGISPAWAWPADGEWTALPLTGAEPFGDLQISDFDGLDLFDGPGDTLRIAADDTYLYLGQRLGADPLIEGFLPAGASWVFLVDLDPAPASGDAAFDYEFTISFGVVTVASNPNDVTGLRPSPRPFVTAPGGDGWGSRESGDVRIVQRDGGTYTIER